MTQKARLWTGATLLLVLALNYAVIGLPLTKKAASLKDRYRAILIKQAKSGELFKNTDDEYLLDLFRKEKASVERRLLILNCTGISFVILIASWTIFGLIGRKR